jgi:triosephosphate isomerase
MKKYIVSNLKMNKNFKDFEKYLIELNSKITNFNNEIIICPSSIFIEKMSKTKINVSIGIQDIDHRDEGAATGSISATQIKNICKYAIVGHSERRDVFKEDNFMIKEKLSRCWENDITPILCIGESLKIRENGIKEIKEHLFFQLDNSLSPDSNWENIIVAYEPIWAIGTGLSATKNEIQEITDLLNDKLSVLSNSYDIPVLYGGSVNDDNFKDFQNINSLSGFLIGSASLDPTILSKIINDF